MGRVLDVNAEKRPLAAPFCISGYVFNDAELTIATIGEGVHVGRGEASGVYYLGDDAANVARVLHECRSMVEAGITREELRHVLPAGGARNAIDCALWDLESHEAGTEVWKLAGIPRPRPLVTTFTLGADTPQNMALRALHYAHARSLKLKLTGDADLDLERVTAVRKARPDAWIAVDANQGYTSGNFDALVAAMVGAGVALIEQPLPRGHEHDLDGYDGPIPLAADESVLTSEDIPGLVGKFQVVNIKLDKCGGLTEALAMVELARKLNLSVMVGNMVGTSLAMAPAFLVGQLCDLADLDGPTFLAKDRVPSVIYADGEIACPEDVWGWSSGGDL